MSKYSFYFFAGLSLVVSLTLLASVQSINSPLLQLTRLEELYGFTSAGLLYAALLLYPLSSISVWLKSKLQGKTLIRDLSISAIYFSLLHGSINFFGLLQGFSGLPFLALPYLLAVILGFSALLLISFLVVYGFLKVKERGLTGKIIERSTYVIALIIAAHVLLVGTDFHNLASPVAACSIGIFLVLSFTYLIAFRDALADNYPRIPSRVVTAVLCLILLGILYGLYRIYGIMLGSHIHTGI